MSTYAIVETGSKQYRVEPQAVIDVEKLEVPEGQTEIALDKVLLVRDGANVRVGTPCVEGATVVCDYLGECRGKKVVVFKFRKRKASQRKRGHRQDLTRLKVKEIKL